MNNPNQTEQAEKTVIEGQQDTAPAGKSSTKSASQKVKRIGDFQIMKKLGQGGMGSVYLAHQLSLDRKIALKVLSTELSQKEDFVKRFIREARVGAKIEHPSVVRCYAVGEHKGIYYAALEFIDGQSMQDWIDQLNTLSIGDAVHIAIVCAQALGHAHKMNLIHRDIKPDNILVTKNGMVKVADLGLAKAVDEDQSMTQSGTGLGTPLYMPPEQARNAKYVDNRSDIYALGSTIYRFLTGVPPYKADSTLELIIAKEKTNYQPASKLNKQVPEALDLIIDKMMARDPKHRYQTCEDILENLIPLGLENQSLSFINSEQVVTLNSGMASGVQSMVSSRSQVNSKAPEREAPKTSREDAKAQRMARAKAQKGMWMVRFKDRTGKEQTKKMNTDQVHRALASELLDETATITKNPKVPFAPIGSAAEFRDQVGEILLKKKEGEKKHKMKSIYDKLDRQHKRRKFWRFLSSIKEGTFGWISLAIWLAVVGAVGYAFYIYAYPILMEKFSEIVGMN